MTTEQPTPLTLTAPGPREVVTAERAQDFVEHWKQEIKEYLEKIPVLPTGDNSAICEKVNLSNKSYTAEAASIIASFLTEEMENGRPPLAQGVKIVDLSDVIASRMEDEGLQVLQILCDAFLHSELEEVDLSDNAMGSKGISACSSVLSGQLSSLSRLSLCNNGLSEQSMKEVATILCAGEDGDENDASDSENICQRLTKIHFFNNMSGNGGCEAFARILSKCSDKLTNIRFSGTRAGRDGSMMVAAAFESINDKLDNLQHLDLADNYFGQDGGTLLSRSLHRCPNLTYLNLRDCCLEDDATGSICRALWSIDAPLVHLDLSGNEISRKGAKNVAQLLEDNNTIRVLHCEENEMTSKGVSYIAKALSPGIEELSLAENQCGSIGAQALLTAYGANDALLASLKSINLDNNSFPSEDVDALIECFGDKLQPMEENDEDDDVDDGLSDSDDDDESDGKEEQQATEDSKEISKLTQKIGGVSLESFC